MIVVLLLILAFFKTPGKIVTSTGRLKKPLKMKYLLILFYTFLGPASYCSAELCASAELSPASTFHIKTTSKVDSTIRAFCLQATSLQENANLQINICNETSKTQMWFKDIYGQIRLKDKESRCIKWKGRLPLTLSPECKNDIYTGEFSNSKIYNFTFDFGEESCDQEEISIYAVKSSAKKRYLGINTDLHIKLFSEVSNIPKWKLKWLIYESQVPSTEPSSKPTVSKKPSFQPTNTPSDVPSDYPSPSPSSKPSPSPTLSQTPSSTPTLFPSDKPSLQPTLFPSDEPSMLPSDEVGCSLRMSARNSFHTKCFTINTIMYLLSIAIIISK